MSRTEKRLISRVLKKTRGNQVKTATMPGISRMTLRKKSKNTEWGI
ncbi:hypothetical protein JW777_05515 [bacterium]|nr:hypothetical protein [bacterium]